MRYLKVHVEGCNVGCGGALYSALDDLTRYTEEDLLQIGQDMANEEHSWGMEVVDESEVPEGDR